MISERINADTEHARATASEHDTESERSDETCPECTGQLISDEEHGEIVCRECGLVTKEASIDHSPEWRAFDTSEQYEKTRVGPPTTQLLHDKGLSSQIGWRNTDAHGKPLEPRQCARMQRLRLWDERFRTRNSKDRNLKQALGEIDRMASALGLSKDIRETAAMIYRRALAADLLPGRSIEAIATAAVYAAARQSNTPRSLDEVAAVSRIDALEFTRAYRYLVRELNLAIAPADPASYVSRFASALDVSRDTEQRARTLLKTAEEQGLHTGKSPIGLAAAALYAAAIQTNEQLTQAAVSEVTNISEVTIRNHYTELLDADTDV